jgi:beta-mannosidase
LSSAANGTEDAVGEIVWTLYHLNGELLEQGRKNVELHYGESKIQHTFHAKPFMKKHGSRNIYLKIDLHIGGESTSRDTVFLTAPRYLNFKREAIAPSLKEISPGIFDLTLAAESFQHQVMWDLPGIAVKANDNFFDLYPGESRIVRLEVAPDLGLAALEKRLTIQSLADSYA